MGGRSGFYILDDYSSLRNLNDKSFEKESILFPVKDARLFIKSSSRYGQGSNYYKAKNPEFGATFTYFLREVPKTLKQIRQKKEKELFKDGKPIPQLSDVDLRKEKNEVDPYLIFTITDENDNVIRKLTKAAKKGIQREVWDLRYQSTSPITEKAKFDPKAKPKSSTLVLTGKYKVAMSLISRDGEKQLSELVEFNVVPLDKSIPRTSETEELIAFQRKAGELTRTISGTESFLKDLISKVDKIKLAIITTPTVGSDVLVDANRIAQELDDLSLRFTRESKSPSSEENAPSQHTINERLSVLRWAHWRSTEPITEKENSVYDILLNEFPPIYERIKEISKIDIFNLEKKLENSGAPYTPRRLPELKLK